MKCGGQLCGVLLLATSTGEVGDKQIARKRRQTVPGVGKS